MSRIVYVDNVLGIVYVDNGLGIIYVDNVAHSVR